MHLLITATHGNRKLLFGPHAIYETYLAGMIDLAGMTPISDPLIKDTAQGRVGFQVLAESHVSIHAVWNGPVTFIDLFTCNALSQEDRYDILSFSRERLGLSKIEHQLLHRGLETLSR